MISEGKKPPTHEERIQSLLSQVQQTLKWADNGISERVGEQNRRVYVWAIILSATICPAFLIVTGMIAELRAMYPSGSSWLDIGYLVISLFFVLATASHVHDKHKEHRVLVDRCRDKGVSSVIIHMKELGLIVDKDAEVDIKEMITTSDEVDKSAIAKALIERAVRKTDQERNDIVRQ